MSELLTKKQLQKLLFGGLFSFGISALLVAVFPFIRLEIDNFWRQQQEQIFPLVAEEFLAKIEQRTKILGDFTNLPPAKPPLILSEAPVDYSNLQNWFGKRPVAVYAPTQESYLLEIPKLKIANALVKVGGVEIDHNLVQFNTDVSLGEYGAPVIFGHSTLRQLYNPKEENKKRYKSIFSTIMTLENGDLITLKQNDIVYTYQVVEKKEVPADDDYILAQNPNLRQIKLVTCTPEGTHLRRGVITAELRF